MNESEQQLRYAEFILAALAKAGGKIERSRMIGLIQEQYNYDPQPELQLEQLMITEGMIEQKGAWLFLTKEGKKAAGSGFRKYMKRQDMLERVRENKDIVGCAASIGTLIGVMLTILSQCS